MRKIIIIVLILCYCSSYSQIITTIVGNGLASNTGDGGIATAASINYPVKIVFDKSDNFYFGLGDNGDCIRKVTSSGIITKFAGIGVAGFSGDGGPALSAQFDNVQDIVFDSSGNMFVADRWNNRIRKIAAATGIITSYAGKGTSGFSGDGGPATNAELSGPAFLCFDKSQNLYISDCINYRIRKVTPSGIISTIAGNGIAGLGANGVPATSVSINPAGLFADDDDLYFADDHGRIFKISMGLISYFIGNGTGIYSGDNALAIDAGIRPMYLIRDKYGNWIISEPYRSRVRIVNSLGIIQTLAGTGIEAYGGDGGPATAANLDHPCGIALDSCGNLYIPDAHKWRIRKVTFPKCNYLETPLENMLSEDISIYPNPIYETLQINNVTSQARYHIINAVGASLQQGTLHHGSNSIDMHALPPAMYMLEITDEDGKRTVHKIIKQ